MHVREILLPFFVLKSLLLLYNDLGIPYLTLLCFAVEYSLLICSQLQFYLLVFQVTISSPKWPPLHVEVSEIDDVWLTYAWLTYALWIDRSLTRNLKPTDSRSNG